MELLARWEKHISAIHFMKINERKHHLLTKSGCAIFIFSMALLASPLNATAAILYEDDFTYDSSINRLPLPAPWVSNWAEQWLEGGWLHNQDNDGWPRDSQALLHDNDPAWRNYEVRARIEVLGPTWTWANLLLRTQAYSSASGTNTGKAYQLVFMDHASGVIGNGPVNRVVLYNTDCENNNCTLTELTDTPLNLGHRGPFDVAVRLEGGQIALSVDGSLIFDIQDPEPLYYGGIGIHNIWESHAHYDNFQVSSVPLPAALPLFASAFFTLGFIGRKYRRQESGVGDTFRRILENGRTGERL